MQRSTLSPSVVRCHWGDVSCEAKLRAHLLTTIARSTAVSTPCCSTSGERLEQVRPRYFIVPGPPPVAAPGAHQVTTGRAYIFRCRKNMHCARVPGKGPTLDRWRLSGSAMHAIGKDTPADGTSDKTPYRRQLCFRCCRRSRMERVAIVSRLGTITGCFQEEKHSPLLALVQQSLTSSILLLLFLSLFCLYHVLEAFWLTSH